MYCELGGLFQGVLGKFNRPHVATIVWRASSFDERTGKGAHIVYTVNQLIEFFRHCFPNAVLDSAHCPAFRGVVKLWLAGWRTSVMRETKTASEAPAASEAAAARN